MDPVDVKKTNPVDETSEDAVANLLRMMQASSMTSVTDALAEKAAVTEGAAEPAAEKVADASAVIGPRLRAIRLRSGILCGICNTQVTHLKNPVEYRNSALHHC